MILFGVRSPLVVELEESLARLGVTVSAAVSVNGTPRVLDRARLVDLADFLPTAGALFLSAAFAPRRRAELYAQAEALGLRKAAALIDPTAILARSVRVGAGSFINAGAIIGGMSFIGEGVLINRAASLGHHSMIGDFVSIGPGATLAGNIHVGEHTVIGAGATILPDVRIGADVIIAAGAVVRKAVADGQLVAGNPAVAMAFKPRRSSLNMADSE